VIGDRQPSVLVVEDDRHIREFVREALQDAGLGVIEAPDGMAAIALAEAKRPDAIVLDIGLPLMGGVEVADRVRELYDTPVPIVVVSAAGRATDVSRIRAVAELVKPFEISDLVSAVTAAVRPAPVPDATQARTAET
jgi:DNA-binding response OmpR family regulator